MLAVRGDLLVGVATYDLTPPVCELCTLHVNDHGSGIGTRLLDAVAAIARERGCDRLWLVTTNDNVRALRFYQRRGLRPVALRPGAVDAARVIEPEIPLVGDHGIPLRDELELELDLVGGTSDR